MARVQIKMWAVVRIQRCFRRFLKRKSQQRESKKKVSNNADSFNLDTMRKAMMVMSCLSESGHKGEMEEAH